MNTQRLLGWLWSAVWRRWMLDSRGRKLRVVRVKGWRTALVEGYYGERQTITPCFSIFRWRFE